jgi:integrase
MGRADWVPSELMAHILAALMPENSLALRVSLRTGLRIDDVLSLRRSDIQKGQRFTVKEHKTGKAKRVYLPEDLHDELMQICGRWYVFEHRTDAKKHRTRQAVNKDLARAAEAFRVPAAVQVSPHSARKIYAVEMFDRYGKPEKVQQLLNHSRESVTLLYCMAEQIYQRKTARRKK